MSRSWVAGAGALMLAGLLAGCGIGSDTKVGSLSSPSLDAPAVAPAPVAMGPFLDGAVGLRLSDADREAAFKAQDDAVSTGERKTWRDAKGVYGYVEPSSAASGGTGDGAGGCRAFTHTIYFGGRPQVGHGTGCRTPDGNWRFTA